MFDSHEWLQHKNAAIRRFPIENPMEKLEHPINVKSFKIDSLIGAPNLYVICTKGSYTFFCVWREWSNKFVCFKIKFCLFLICCVLMHAWPQNMPYEVWNGESPFRL